MKLLQTLCLGAVIAYQMNAAGVTITSPSDGSTVSSPVQLSASISSRYKPTAMLAYVNGALVLETYGVSSLSTSLNLSDGNYTITVIAQFSDRHSSIATTSITVSSAASTPPGSGQTVAEQIAADMQGSNEGFPQGVPLSYDWANGPIVEDGNNSQGGQAITAWGVVYVASQGNPAENTRVNIRNVQLYFLQKSTGKWLLLQNTSSPDGADYPDDFQGDSVPGDVRTESDGTISATAGNGYCFHFYPSNRGSIDPNDIGGIVTLFEARLIVGNTSLADDRSSAQYLASAGADYYPSVSGAGIENNPSVANGKMKYVQVNWRSFAMTTLSESQLAINPPPVDLSGILP